MLVEGVRLFPASGRECARDAVVGCVHTGKGVDAMRRVATTMFLALACVAWVVSSSAVAQVDNAYGDAYDSEETDGALVSEKRTLPEDPYGDELGEEDKMPLSEAMGRGKTWEPALPAFRVPVGKGATSSYGQYTRSNQQLPMTRVPLGVNSMAPHNRLQQGVHQHYHTGIPMNNPLPYNAPNSPDLTQFPGKTGRMTEKRRVDQRQFRRALNNAQGRGQRLSSYERFALYRSLGGGDEGDLSSANEQMNRSLYEHQYYPSWVQYQARPTGIKAPFLTPGELNIKAALAGPRTPDIMLQKGHSPLLRDLTPGAHKRYPTTRR